jgi:hypothetical protein
MRIRLISLLSLLLLFLAFSSTSAAQATPTISLSGTAPQDPFVPPAIAHLKDSPLFPVLRGSTPSTVYTYSPSLPDAGCGSIVILQAPKDLDNSMLQKAPKNPSDNAAILPAIPPCQKDQPVRTFSLRLPPKNGGSQPKLFSPSNHSAVGAP